jgi:hypothetical protein
LLFRPGLPRPSSDTEPLDRVIGGFQNPDYREIFDRLDLELRFVIGTSDGAVRQSSVEAVKAALDGLRAANANARR